MEKKQFAVLGLGRFGISIVETLSEKGYDVLAVDNCAENVEIVSSYATYAVKADISDERALEELGLKNYDIVIVAVGGNIEANVLATLFAKECGCYVISKASNTRHREILSRIGADQVVLPERDMGKRLANSLLYGSFMDFIELSDQFSIAESKLGSHWLGKSLMELNIRRNYGINIVAIRHGNELTVTPGATEVIHKDDTVIMIGKNDKIQKFLALIAEGENENDN